MFHLPPLHPEVQAILNMLNREFPISKEEVERRVLAGLPEPEYITIPAGMRLDTLDTPAAIYEDLVGN